MKILLAVDGSPNSTGAVKTLIKHMDWFRAKPVVRLINVRLEVPRIGGMGSAVSKASLSRYYAEEGEQALAKARRLLERASVKFDAKVLVGRPAEAIVAEAQNAACDLIYMGTRGLGAVSNMLVGSIATKVLNLATVPVLIVK